LATSLNNLAIWLSELGQREEALAAVKEAVGLYRDLVRAQPAVPVARPGLLGTPDLVLFRVGGHCRVGRLMGKPV
jgi:hypothetical protein